MKSILNNIYEYLPHEIVKKIKKTAEGRGGKGIYKRRNKRSYRVLIQYKTWNKLMKNNPKILDEYEQGYAVIISPEEYFGDNYPNKSDELNENFELSKTGFVLYTLITEYNKYPPITEWNDVIEIVSKGSSSPEEISWSGDYVLNVKNGGKVSYICGKNHKRNDPILIEKQELIKKWGYLNKIPEQCGLGNYDYDYANEKTIENVQLQMLYLLLTTKTSDGLDFSKYIYDNFENFIENTHNNNFKNLIRNLSYEEYKTEFNRLLLKLEDVCENEKLLDYNKFKKIGIWNEKSSQLICPLCQNPVYTENFFEDINQMEGREVLDNTQKNIVLMHIRALRPAEFNHRNYNLGWGHNFCNKVQGENDIEDTIITLENIIKSYYELKQ